ncbi:hypothetical protein CBR_g3676 [Chara braunii]|uniref:Uncharacterized protein n=1 Tax=Chara braunii TaxID=69332 RepID=A0A388KG46_CHABU|nr:hypothetical protein CBR_g3676 [Chara braunii]|eukprot:GBG68977.1 hypothetical protein CBR_g3676 [Chara braunii]
MPLLESFEGKCEPVRKRANGRVHAKHVVLVDFIHSLSIMAHVVCSFLLNCLRSILLRVQIVAAILATTFN